jgi:hypothetical protein
VDDSVAMVSFDTRLEDDGEPQFEDDIPHISLTESEFGVADTADLEPLYTALSEIVLSIDQLIDFVTDTDAEYRVDLVTVQMAEGVARSMLKPADGTRNWKRRRETEYEQRGRLEFGIEFASVDHREIDGILSAFRFDHVRQLQLYDGSVLPVHIVSSLFPETEPPEIELPETEGVPETENDVIYGQPIHFSDYQADLIGIENLDIREELDRLDLREFVAGDDIYPEPPSEWPRPE